VKAYSPVQVRTQDLQIKMKGENKMKRKYYYQVPEVVKRKTRYYQKNYCLGLADAFKEAVRDSLYHEDMTTDLYHAFMENDFRNYIPQCYIDSVLTVPQRFFVKNNCIK